MSINRTTTQRPTTDSLSDRMTWIRMAQEANSMEETTKRPTKSVASGMFKCSMCSHPFKRADSKVFPFCSVRCQQLDLGQWLDERLGLPVEGHEEQEYTMEDDYDE